VRARVDVGQVHADPHRLRHVRVRRDLLAQLLVDREPLRFGPPVHPDDGVRERLARAVDRHEARALSPDADGNDARSARPRDRRAHRLARARPPQRGVLLDPTRTASFDEGIRTIGETQEHAFEIDDAGLDAAGAEVDREQTVGRHEVRARTNATR
jgi:hypothetical protein